MSEGFDPQGLRKRMIRLKNKGGGSSEYLGVKWRVYWFREEWPCGSLETEHVVLNDQAAVFRATVRKVDAEGVVHGTAMGYGSETANDFKDFTEKAETKAIGRALSALGFDLEYLEPEAVVTMSEPAARPQQAPPRPQPSAPAPPATGTAAENGTLPGMTNSVANWEQSIGRAPSLKHLEEIGRILVKQSLDDHPALMAAMAKRDAELRAQLAEYYAR